jgi:hypothetical protein
MVQACERRVNGEPSLVVGRGHINWMMLSLIALTRQKQLASQASSKPTSLAFLVGTAVPLRLSQNYFWEPAGNGTARNNSRK